MDIGTGVFSWPRSERVSDRYGLAGVADAQGVYRVADNLPVGKRGKLMAEILETRRSEHIGDFFRGLFPVTPKAGEVFSLGEGTLFIANVEDAGVIHEYVGLKPNDDRESDWLDPRALYHCHQQTVALRFFPTETT